MPNPNLSHLNCSQAEAVEFPLTWQMHYLSTSRAGKLTSQGKPQKVRSNASVLFFFPRSPIALF